MNLRAAILEEHSKRQTLMIQHWVGANAKRFDELMQLFLGDEYRITQRSGWVVQHVSQQHPNLVLPYLDDMVEILFDNEKHPAARRNILKILDESVVIPERLFGKLATLCFELIESMKEPVASKVYSMGVLCQIIKHEPDLADELILLIEEMMPYNSAAFKSRGKRTLKWLQKNIKNQS